MTIITIVMVVIAGFAICTQILIGMKNRNARIAKSKYVRLSELGSQLNLSFSSHWVVNNKLIALDGLKRMLLVLEINNEMNQPKIIDLNQVVAVSIKKSYGSIKSGELRDKPFDEFLKTVDLQFGFRDKGESVVLAFYDSEMNALSDLPALERNARNWQLILSRLTLPGPVQTSEHSNKLQVA